MDLNEIIAGIGEEVGCEVEENVYTGDGKRYATFTYEDERPEIAGDNLPVADTAYIQISYFAPKDYSYKADKRKIRDYLERNGFIVTAMRSWVESAVSGYQDTRRVLFETQITQKREQEE